MPTLKKFGAISVRMYADDHRPPHFHIVGPDFEVLVQMSDFTILAGTARKAQISDAMTWARENAQGLIEKWAELNERG